MPLKEIWIDCETGGTDVRHHPLLQICGKIIIDGQSVEKFDIFMRNENQVLDNEALKVIGRTPLEIAGWQPPAEAYSEFKRIVSRYVDQYNKRDKFHWFGYNPRFDMDFVREWFSRQGNKYFGSYFWTPPIDVWMLAMYGQMRQRADFTDAKLWTVAQWYGVDVTKFSAHNAQDDIAVTQELYKKVCEVLCIKH